MEGETKEDKMKQIKEKEDEHMYHVLEGPTVVQVGCVYVRSGQHNLLVIFDCTEMFP